MRPQNVGIHAIEVYFPQTFVKQEDLETYNKIDKGKYTVGLGQLEMAFTLEQEDVNSISLTVVQNLLEKYNIDPKRIGRLEVGTETLLDKSKSTKTFLMQLFKESGNQDIEGVTSINACYGGTNAIFNTISWIESSSWDGRYGIAICADIAVYDKGPARPTGGAGAIALLIGPDAPIVFDTVRSSFIDHAYDFYKPDPNSEYPTVDGKNSINTYLGAITNCYATLKQKQIARGQKPLKIDQFDFGCFHAPFAKMVQKAFYKLVSLDLVNGDIKSEPQVIEDIKTLNFDDKKVQGHLNKYAAPIYKSKVAPSLFLGQKLGNIYTGSLYSGLISLVSDEKLNLEGKTILMFSYGSGLASSMFQLRVVKKYDYIRQIVNLKERLSQRQPFTADDFEKVMAVKQTKYGKKEYKLENDLTKLAEGTFYLTEVDNFWRRFYKRNGTAPKPKIHIKFGQEGFSQNSGSKNDASLSQKSKGEVQIEIQQGEGGAQRLEQLSKHFKESTQKDNHKVWNGFYKKTVMERLDQIQKLNPEINSQYYLDGGLQIQNAELMVENCIGKISIPLGLGLNFKINRQFYQIPMAVEEPSVIAAASSAAKFVSDNGKGFITSATNNIMIGQIQLLECNFEKVNKLVIKHQKELVNKANEGCQNMLKRGGGVKRIRARRLTDKTIPGTDLDEMAVIDVFIDVCESMGANIINTVLESVSPFIQELFDVRCGLRILSNLCVERTAKSVFQIPVKKMSWKNATGETVAKRILEAYRFAVLDPFRAATHNKGIMNGIDAVAVALGQDWRSIEASCHAFASHNSENRYKPLTRYEIVKDEQTGEDLFQGTIEIPIAVGSKGGVLESNQIYQNNLRILNYPNAQMMAQIMATVGLSQNFAAIRALSIEGIQKGHMSLHARNIAITAGVPSHLVEDCVRYMKKRSRINNDSAREYIQAYDIHTGIRQIRDEIRPQEQVLSTFYIELPLPNQEEQVRLHIAFDCRSEAHHITIEKTDGQISELHRKVVGSKGFEWMNSMFQYLENLRLDMLTKNPDQIFTFKLKLICVIIDLVIYNMMHIDARVTTKTVKLIEKGLFQKNIDEIIDNQPMEVKYGLSLIAELFSVFNYNLLQNSKNHLLNYCLKEEIIKIMNGSIEVYNLHELSKNNKYWNFDKFLQSRQKRLCVTMMHLCDTLNLRNEQTTQDVIDLVKEVGNIHEIEITAIRDMNKWDPVNIDHYNMYQYWLESQQLTLTGNSSDVKQKFVDLMIHKLNYLKENIKPRVDKKLQGILRSASQVIRDYYDFNINNFKNSPDGQVTLKTNVKPSL